MKHPITLRVDSDLLQAAKRRARVENRTLTNFVETILKQHIAAAEAVLDRPDFKSENHSSVSALVPSDMKRTINRKPFHD